MNLPEGFEANEDELAQVRGGLTDAFAATEEMLIPSPTPGAARLSFIVQELIAMANQRFPDEGRALLAGVADGLGRAVAQIEPDPREQEEAIKGAIPAIGRGCESMRAYLQETSE